MRENPSVSIINTKYLVYENDEPIMKKDYLIKAIFKSDSLSKEDVDIALEKLRQEIINKIHDHETKYERQNKL